MKLNYPTKRMIIPEALGPVPNGKLPRRLLRKTKAGGMLYTPVAKAFNQMWAAAKADGVVLKLTGNGYRSYERQYEMFMERFSLKNEGRIPTVIRRFDKRTYYLRRGFSPSAVPGFSNHGYGLAVDVDLSDPKVFAWLDKNAPTYGFYLQGKPIRPDGSKNPEYEPWHWQKVDA